ncbi:MAG: glutaminyl-tRNA synthetase [Proteiniphilum sp. 51_7]|nr:MAG: glutaminyl-tRNA synthetase [Proteiniphilum sp. 51_7]
MDDKVWDLGDEVNLTDEELDALATDFIRVAVVEGIVADVRWLGWDFGDTVLFGSDYFEQMFAWAVQLVEKGRAYVDDLSPEQIREYRGTLTDPGKNSPYRDRSVEENLDLFHRMRAGEFPEGSRVLRAKIDMASPNLNLRDPVMYRILHQSHHRQGDAWCIYPMYDWAHGLEDSIEGITHSLCDLGYRDHRPLYDWFLDELGIYHPQQLEFARLFMTYTVLSKRKLLQLVQGGYVNGWDDPRMPTIAGMRRRGYTPQGIHNFIDRIGYTKYDGMNDISLLEHAVREDLNKRVMRVSGVIDPVKLILTNYPEGQVEEMEAINNPEDESMGSRKVKFTRELWIERDDFMEEAPQKYFRLTPGNEVRLKNAYIVKCTGCKKDELGNVTEVYAAYDPQSRSGMPEANRRVKGTIHWVSVPHSLDAEVRLYDRLFMVEDPSAEKEKDFRELINPDSLIVKAGCKVEAYLKDAKPLESFQFQRIGYFNVDRDSTEGKLVFNRTVALKDSWKKQNG